MVDAASGASQSARRSRRSPARPALARLRARTGLRRNQCQSDDRRARSRHPIIPSSRLRPQESRRLSCRSRRRRDLGGRPSRALGRGGSASGSRRAGFDRRPRRFICRGCYYIYDEAQGAPHAGAPFDALSSDWRCPDCGTDKTTFRPHVESAA
ncbi:MAG: rubredoxin [Roseiarcus sp.]